MRTPSAVLLLTLCCALAHADGQRIYNRACVACHMAEGRGAPQVAPPLREHVACFAQQADGRAYLAGVLEHGLEGPITVEGELFDDYMPPAANLSSAEKASVLDYLVSLSSRCAGPTEPFTAAEVEAALNEDKWDSQTIRALREQLMQAPAAPGAHASPVGDSAASSPARPQPAAAAQAAADFVHHCRGCHTPQGDAVPGGVPALKENVGLFLHSAAGRAFLVQVPGVAFAPLEDQRLANLLNWVIESLSAEQAPASFAPYTAAEIAEYRQQALLDVDAARMRILAQLQSNGLRIPQ